MPNFRVLKDGTRIAYTPLDAGKRAAAPKRTFADAKDNAIAAMDKLGLYQHVLARMDRRIATGKGGYKRHGA